MLQNVPDEVVAAFDAATEYLNAVDFAPLVDVLPDYVSLDELTDLYTYLETTFTTVPLEDLDWEVTRERRDDDDDSSDYSWSAIDVASGISISYSEVIFDDWSFIDISIEDSYDIFDWEGFSYSEHLSGDDDYYTYLNLDFDTDASVSYFQHLSDEGPEGFFIVGQDAPELNQMSDVVALFHISEDDLSWAFDVFTLDGIYDFNDISADVLDFVGDSTSSYLRDDSDSVYRFKMKFDDDLILGEVNVTYEDGVEYTAGVTEDVKTSETFIDGDDIFDWSEQTRTFDVSGQVETVIEMDTGVTVTASDDAVQMSDLADAFDWAEARGNLDADGDIDTIWTRFDNGTTAHVTFADSGATYAKVKDVAALADWSELSVYTSADGTHTSARVLWDDGQSEVMALEDMPDDWMSYDAFGTAVQYADLEANILYTLA